MKNDDISKQYNVFDSIYSEHREIQDEIGNRDFYSILGTLELKNKKILDIGCGDGSDISIISKIGAIVSGIDASENFVKKAIEKNPNTTILVGRGESLPFDDQSFDIVISKYALQTSNNVPLILKEVSRVCKPGGYLVYLSKHPLRQFLEKIKTFGHNSDYFEQKVVKSEIYEGKIVLNEPTHTMTEYFNADFLKNFDIIDFKENFDFPASEQINGDKYPTFFVLKCRRR